MWVYNLYIPSLHYELCYHRIWIGMLLILIALPCQRWSYVVPMWPFRCLFGPFRCPLSPFRCLFGPVWYLFDSIWSEDNDFDMPFAIGMSTLVQ